MVVSSVSLCLFFDWFFFFWPSCHVCFGLELEFVPFKIEHEQWEAEVEVGKALVLFFQSLLVGT